MNSEIKKIEDKIWSLLRENRQEKVSKTIIRRKLSRQGFKSSDIEDALNRVWKERRGTQRIQKIDTPKSIPTNFYLSEKDRMRLSDESYLALQRLHFFQMITPLDRILLLEWIEQIPGRITLEKLVEIVELALGPRYSYEVMKMIIGVAIGDESVFM
ncbi:MAG TPA: DUF494 family protein [Candidatus Hydrogenedens sp.]|nr:DUF494 family protein [Candidatus Hydrogenedens sp.]